MTVWDPTAAQAPVVLSRCKLRKRSPQRWLPLVDTDGASIDQSQCKAYSHISGYSQYIARDGHILL